MGASNGLHGGVRIRGLVKTTVATALSWTGADSLLGALAGKGRGLVLGYHRVVEDFRGVVRYDTHCIHSSK